MGLVGVLLNLLTCPNSHLSSIKTATNINMPATRARKAAGDAGLGIQRNQPNGRPGASRADQVALQALKDLYKDTNAEGKKAILAALVKNLSPEDKERFQKLKMEKLNEFFTQQLFPMMSRIEIDNDAAIAALGNGLLDFFGKANGQLQASSTDDSPSDLSVDHAMAGSDCNNAYDVTGDAQQPTPNAPGRAAAVSKTPASRKTFAPKIRRRSKKSPLRFIEGVPEGEVWVPWRTDTGTCTSLHDSGARFLPFDEATQQAKEVRTDPCWSYDSDTDRFVNFPKNAFTLEAQVERQKGRKKGTKIVTIKFTNRYKMLGPAALPEDL